MKARSPLAVVFFTVFLDLIGFGILIPIQPFYAEFFGARPATVTLLSASYSLMQFLFAPLLGRVSDRVGRRPIMLFSIAANALGYALFGLAGSLTLLFVARITSGLGSANLGTAQAIIADVTTPETRAKGMGLIGAAFGLGFVFGPAFGGFFGQFGLAVPAFVAAGLSLLNWLSAYFLLPETRSASGARTSLSAPPSLLGLSPRALQNAMRHANVAQLLWVYLIGTLAFSQLEQVLGLFIERNWAGTSSDPTAHLRRASALTSYFLVAVGVTATIVQGTLTGRIAKRLGERRMVQLGTFLVAVSMAILPVVANLRSFPIFLLMGPFIAIGTSLTNPALPSLLSQSVEGDAFGGTLGLGQSLSSLGRVIGPSTAGILFELHTGAPFWVGAVLMSTCTLVALTLGVRAKVEASS